MKKTRKIKLSTMVKDTRALYSRSIGVLFVYTFLFSVLQDELYLPVMRKLWSLALRTVEEGYISDHNFTAFFTHPLVLMTGLLALGSFCILALWETAGIHMILEFAHQGKPVRLFSVFRESLVQIRHCLKPENWMIFVYVLLIQPLIDSNYSGNLLSSITIPEFIMDFIMSRTVLIWLLILVMVVCLIFFLRYLFLPIIMILERKNFREASRKSALFMHGRYFRTYWKILFASFIGTITLRAVPNLISFGLETALKAAYRNDVFTNEIGQYVFRSLFDPILDTLGKVFIKIFVSAMVLVVYHIFEAQLALPSEITLPERCIKTHGKIHSLKIAFYAIYCFVFIGAAVMYAALMLMSETNPAMVDELVNKTLIAAHKGYSSRAPENTMPAFALAVDCEQADFIELDVRETKDGVPVVIHDASLQMPAGLNRQIYDVTFAQLQEIPATYGFDSAEFGNARIPSLEQVLEQYAGKKDFLIEIKASDLTPELPAKIVALMEKYGITETSLVHSGSYPSLKAVKEINPDIQCGFIIAISTSGYADLPYADFFSVEHTYISENMISQIHDRDKKVFVWTVNEEASFNQVRDMGVDMLITDYPKEAYEGIHRYDQSLIEKLTAIANFPDLPLGGHSINYHGTGD